MTAKYERADSTDDLVALVKQVKAEAEELLRSPPITNTDELQALIDQVKAKARKAKRRRKGKKP